MKGKILALSLFSALSTSVLSAEPSMGFFDDGRVDVIAGLSSHEGETGYYVNGQWNITQYAVLGLGADSYVRRSDFSVGDFFPDSDFADNLFRPRHTTYSLYGTLRYPFELSSDSQIAPFVTFGFNQMSTEDVEIGESDNSVEGDDNANSGNSDAELVLSFTDMDAFSIRIGAQWQINQRHLLSIGAVGYSLDDDWSELTLEDQHEGGFVSYRYQYSPLIGFTAGIDTVDIFGDANARFGLSFSF